MDKIFKSMLEEIDSFEDDGESYNDKLSKAWAKGFGEALDLQREADRKQREKEESERKTVEKANTMAKAAGLNMDSFERDGKAYTTVDYDLFWHVIAQSEPEGDTVEDRINWAINEVKQKKAAEQEPIEKLRKKSKETQTKNQVLDKGVTKIPETKKETESPLSLEDAIAKNMRRI